MFSKKHPILFISKHFIDPGHVILGKRVSFDGLEALPYTAETLPDVLRRIETLLGKNIRMVLSEELVYVTGLSFPAGTTITRDVVRRAMEEATPEDLRSTAWDFQTLHYAKKRETSEETLVQAAVVEGKFFHLLKGALELVPLSVASIVPESYALAQLAAHLDASLLITRDREGTLLVAFEAGLVIAARLQPSDPTLADVERLLAFIAERKLRKISRVIFSHFSQDELAPFQKLAADGCTLVQEEYNPLVGAALIQKTKGKDAEVLNLNGFLFDREKPWWKIW